MDTSQYCMPCRKIDTTKNSRKKEAIAYFRIESAAALTVSVFINVAVLAVFAKGFYSKGIADIGLENAANYLGNAFGSQVVRDASLALA